MSVVPVALRTIYDGWENYQHLVLRSLESLNPEQLALRVAPRQWSVWQLASHIAGSRAYWFHDVLREGDPAVRDMFRVTSTTVPGIHLDDAGWEDDENHPRTAAEIVEALQLTWRMIGACLQQWTPKELEIEFTRQGRTRTQTRSRAWVIWHLIEHDVHHGGEISQILGSHGLPALDL